MNIQWPCEEEKDGTEKDKFLSLLEAFPLDLPEEFEQIIEWIVKQSGDVAELKDKVNAACQHIDLHYLDDSEDLLMTWLCAIALSRSPCLKTWRKIKGFIYLSSVIEYDLSTAMMALAENNSDIEGSYLKLAKKVFSALEKSSLKSNSDRTNKDREGIIQHWSFYTNKLEEIWQGLRLWNGMSYWEDYASLNMLRKLEPSELMQVLSQSNNPYLCQSVLSIINAGGVVSQLHEWKLYILAAPVAFKKDGEWNGTVVVPLLLVEAYRQLIDAQYNICNVNTSDNVEEIKNKITSSINSVVDILSEREDSPPLFCRWTTWLMREQLSESGNNIGNSQLQPFVAKELINAIGKKLKNQPVIQRSPSDAPQWEYWCYQCVLASYAYDKFIDAPDCDNFIEEWVVSFDDWNSDKGRLLRERASLLMIFGKKEMPGIAENLLAYPLAQLELPTDTWINIWNNIYTLREIVEFGDATDNEYQAQTDASKLLLIMFRVGLAIFDQRAEKCENCDSSISKEQVKLFKMLFSAAREMQEIDSTLNYEEWQHAILHLSIRRYIWEQQSPELTLSNHPSIFCFKDTPTIHDCLYEAKSDVVELLKFLQSILMNEIDIPTFKNNLDMTSINVTDVLDKVRKLNMYNSQKYPVDEMSLKGIEDKILGD